MKKKVISMLLAVSMISASPVFAAEFSDGSSIVVDNAGEGNSAEKDLSAATSENEDSAGSSAEIGNSSLFSDSIDSNNLVDSFDSPDSAAAAENPVFSDQLIPAINDYSDLQAAGSVRDDTVSSSNTYNITVEGTLIRSEAAEFVRLVNEARAERGLNPVTLDQKVQDVSEQRAIHLISMYSHDIPDGDGSLNYWYGECISAGFVGTKDNARDFFNSWKNSPAHWNLLMTPKYQSIGFAEFESDTGAVYAVTNLYKYSSENPITTSQENEKSFFSFNIEKKYIDNNYVKQTYRIINNANLKLTIKEKNIEGGTFFTITSINGEWESSNPEVATVDNDGNVTAVSPGTAIIRYYVNGNRNHSLDTTINVASAKALIIQAYVPRMSPMAQLKWDLTKDILDNENSMGYQVFVYDSVAGKYVLQNDVSIDQEDFADDYFTNVFVGYGATKKIKIRLYEKQSNGEKFYGEYSNAVTVSTAPGYVKMKSVTMKNKKAYLKWTKSENADGYAIFRRIGKTGSYKRIKTINSGDVVKYTNSKLTYGKKYCYKVKAFYVTPEGKKVYTNYSNTKSKTCR